MLRSQAPRLLRLAARHAAQQQQQSSLGGEGLAWASAQQLRHIGGDRVPEFYAKPSPYTEGTTFLGTPANHDELVKKRPLAPDVFEIDMKGPHYKFPFGAISSVMNRVTGVALSAGFTAAGYVALTGDLPGALAAFRADHAVLAVPVKFVVAYPLIYHWLGGVRHFVWDLHKIGNNADKTSLLEKDKVEQSSKVLLGVSLVLSSIVALL
ncbi:succinate dehydrogenase subunit b560 [Raphidocelis subcapitata]|uniref:Succinate dehydrogenase subunit b560 n=1 Tax=Raphidocelis subcapitata TaxID=307507 RepID=A0A2V0P9B1_9CHLO|nr:succinate dehydrogenase subunit b560 [Raphidocelis subcapitata]|eukprot:GBF94483.1 succinate dehydrogenase subunit b560 [Raphidocelis subcapitata]